jgi:hypothetical protein
MDPGSSSYQHPYRETSCNIVMVILVVEVMTDDGDHCGGGPVKGSPERDTGSMGVQQYCINFSVMILEFVARKKSMEIILTRVSS